VFGGIQAVELKALGIRDEACALPHVEVEAGRGAFLLFLLMVHTNSSGGRLFAVPYWPFCEIGHGLSKGRRRPEKGWRIS
jgi:hypothetical protein